MSVFIGLWQPWQDSRCGRGSRKAPATPEIRSFKVYDMPLSVEHRARWVAYAATRPYFRITSRRST